jgi:hypothetical protein
VSEHSPDWSPDGTQIAFIRAKDVWLMDPSGSNQTQLTHSAFNEDANGCAFDGHLGNSSPEWSPNGSRIAYVFHGHLDDTDCFRIRTVNRDGTLDVKVFGEPGTSWPTSLAWGGAGGTRIAFIDSFADPAQINTIYADGTGLIAPLGVQGYPGQLDWRALSPDDSPSMHVRPKAASPVQASLVPAFRACTAPNRTHGPPLAYGSCTPPISDSQLTAGAGDGDPSLARSTGFIRFATKVGAAGPPDDTDVAIRFRLTHVMWRSNLAEYTGELLARADTRITDREGAVSSTSMDLRLEFVVPCVATPDLPYDKATCAVTTTVEALVPGAAVEGSRAVWQFQRMSVYDGGGDAHADTTHDNKLFAVSGVFVP